MFLAILALAFDVGRIGHASQPTCYQYDDLVLLFARNAKGYRHLATLFFFLLGGHFSPAPDIFLFSFHLFLALNKGLS